MNDVTTSGAATSPNVATTLAFERTRIAYERTMMAWVRTATSLITFGFSVYKFFQFEMKEACLTDALDASAESGEAGAPGRKEGSMWHIARYVYRPIDA